MLKRFLRGYADFTSWLSGDWPMVIFGAAVSGLLGALLMLFRAPGDEKHLEVSWGLWATSVLVLWGIVGVGYVLLRFIEWSGDWAREQARKEAKPKPLRDYLYEQAKRELDEMFPADKE